MEYVELGRTGVNVSRLGFGGAPAGLANYLEPYSPTNQQQRRQVTAALEQAVTLGITYFDTAPSYGDGESETIFGEVLAGIEPPIFLATKISWPVSDLRSSIEASLKRLKRDYVDLLQIHGTSYSKAVAEAILQPGGLLDQMERLKEEGLIRFTGFTSEDNNPAVYRFIESGRFEVMQINYNFLFQHPTETSRPFGSMYEAEKHGLGICTMRTLTSGLFQKWVQLANPQNSFDYSPALLQFVLSNPLVDVALVGMRTPEIVEENVRICNDMSGRIDLAELQERYV